MLSPGEKTPKLNDHLLGLMGLGVRGTDSCLDDPSFGELAEGMEIGDNYRLLTLAGEGGCGVVWMAEQLDLYNQRVALKFLRSDAVSRLGHRFDSERRVLSRLHHPGIVAARAVGMTEGGLPYLVMDWVDGVPITLFCDQEKMGIKARVALVIQVCQALQHAHLKGILHLDIKPSNILVEKTTDGGCSPKIIDFGICRFRDLAEITHSNPPLDAAPLAPVEGTPQYMSPEQVNAEADVEVTSDVFALGILLFELCTGETPLSRLAVDRDSMLSFFERVLHEEPPTASQRIESKAELNTMQEAARRRGDTPRGLVRATQGDLDAIIAQSLRKDPRQRYQSVEALAADLQRFIDREPVAARKGEPLYTARRWVGRNKALTLLAGAAVVASITALSSWMKSEAEAKDRLKVELELAQQTSKQQAAAVFLGGMFEELDSCEDLIIDGDSVRSLVRSANERRKQQLTDDPDLSMQVGSVLARALTRIGRLGEAAQMWSDVAEEGASLTATLPVESWIADVQSAWCKVVEHTWQATSLDEVKLDAAVHQSLRQTLERCLKNRPSAIDPVHPIFGVKSQDGQHILGALQAVDAAFPNHPEVGLERLRQKKQEFWPDGLRHSPVSGWYLRQEALFLAQMGQYDEALAALRQARAILSGKTQEAPFRLLVAVDFHCLEGLILSAQGKPAAAAQAFHQEWLLRQSLGDSERMSSLRRLATAHLQSQQPQEAVQVLNTLKEIAQKQGDWETETQALEDLVGIYRADTLVDWDTFLGAKMGLAANLIARAEHLPPTEAKASRALLVRALGVLKTMPDPRAPVSTTTRSQYAKLLGEALARCGRFSEAAEVADQGAAAGEPAKCMHQIWGALYRELAGERADFDFPALIDEARQAQNVTDFALAAATLLRWSSGDDVQQAIQNQAVRWEAAVPGSDEIALVRGIAALRNREIDEARQWLTLAAGQRDSANSVAQLARWILGLQIPSQQTQPGSPEWNILGSPTTGLTDPPERFLGRLVLTAWQRAMEKDPTLAFPLNLTEATPPETNP